MKFKVSDIQASAEQKINLAQWPTRVRELYDSKEDYERQMRKAKEQVSELQERHYSSRAAAILLIFQGMDAAGKDGAIEHVMSGINPQGCTVMSFKEPSTRERHHDFLWRTVLPLPERGHIGIFNRSYYEDVLIVKVHPELLNTENAPNLSERKKLWEHRYESINNFEKHLTRNNTVILKFFLHISKNEQRDRFLARIDDAEKNWKIVPADFEERKFWAAYQKAYAEAISATSTKYAPWHIVPADDKENARLMILRTLEHTLEGMGLEHPKTTAARSAELKKLRKDLEKS